MTKTESESETDIDAPSTSTAVANSGACQWKKTLPTDYYVRKWTDIDVPEMKAFFNVRILMECAVVTGETPIRDYSMSDKYR